MTIVTENHRTPCVLSEHCSREKMGRQTRIQGGDKQHSQLLTTHLGDLLHIPGAQADSRLQLTTDYITLIPSGPSFPRSPQEIKKGRANIFSPNKNWPICTCWSICTTMYPNKSKNSKSRNHCKNNICHW